VLGNVVNAVLSVGKAMRAKTTPLREVGSRLYNARLLIVGTVEARVDLKVEVRSQLCLTCSSYRNIAYVPKMLREVVLPEARLHSSVTLADTKSTNPRFRRIALLLIPLPVALAAISLATFSCALVDFVGVALQQLWVIGRIAAFSATSQWPLSGGCCCSGRRRLCVVDAGKLWEQQLSGI
jgi:hypothetical protein